MNAVKSGLIALALAGVSTAWAGGGYVADTSATAQPGVAYRYTCPNGQTVGVRYIMSDPQLKSDPTFVVLDYKGNHYGLAPAPSASGTRYVGLSGMDTASGLEWIEHQGEGLLSRYDNATGETTFLVTDCKINL